MAKETKLFRGLDLRSNALEREGNTARDCSNVRLDFNRRLIKREEFAAKGVPRDGTGDATLWDSQLPTGSIILDFVKYEESFILFVKQPTSATFPDYVNKVYRYYPGVGALVEIQNNNGNVGFHADYGYANPQGRTFDDKVTHFIKNGCLYWLSKENSGFSGPEGTPLMMKFDGDVWHAAGVEDALLESNVADSGTAPSTQRYVRYVPFAVDAQGNFTYGQWWVRLETLNGNDVEKNTPYALADAKNYSNASFTLNGAQTVSDSSLTVAARDINCVEGQYVLMSAIGNLIPIVNLYRFKIETISGGNITLSEPQFFSSSTGTWDDATSFSWSLPDYHPFSAVQVAAYFSDTYDIGYEFGTVAGAAVNPPPSSFWIDFDVTAPDNISDSALPLTRLFEDFYGSDIKGNPPPGIQVEEYGDGILLIDEKTVYFSDLSINGTVENFTAFENFNVGKSSRGKMTGIFANETFIVAFREEASYLIVGNIYTGNYRIQAFRSTQIGCSSPTSIEEVGGQAAFMSNRGPSAAAENGSLGEFGNPIEPMFTEDILGLNLDLSSADVAIDFNRELAYMFVESGNGSGDDIVLVYDYNYQEWFKYGGLNARGGISVYDKKVYYSDGTDLYVEDSAYTAVGVNAFYKTNFETLKEFSRKKRFQRLVLFLTDLYQATIGFKAYKDWNTASAYTDTTLTTDAAIPIDLKRLSPKTCYASSFEIISEGDNQLTLDGFEYEFEIEGKGVADEVR